MACSCKCSCDCCVKREMLEGLVKRMRKAIRSAEPDADDIPALRAYIKATDSVIMESLSAVPD